MLSSEGSEMGTGKRSDGKEGSDRIPETSKLDIVSEPNLPLRHGNQASAKKQAGGKQPANKVRTVRVLFGCCNVYANLGVPKHVQELTSDVWRVHCVRCGRLVELPVE